MSAHPYELTKSGLISALSPKAGLLPQMHPTLLRDALFMKRARGDADADPFKAIACREYASMLDATISGAAFAMRQWLAKADKLRWSDEKRNRCAAFLADLAAIENGDRAGWTPPHERAAA